MTASVLVSELSNLLQESKRKNVELKNASEKSLHDLKSLANTSETGLTADLSRRPYFVSPFIIACKSRNSKVVNSGITGIQRLVIARALSKDRLHEILDSLRECSLHGPEIQIRVLQILPQFLQNYPEDTNGDNFAKSLQICATFSSSKATTISGTTSATLQQLIVMAFDRVMDEDKSKLQIPAIHEISTDKGTIMVRNASFDAYRTFQDLCLLLEGVKTSFVQLESITKLTGLDIIESILANHFKLFADHAELMQLMYSYTMPMIIRSLSEKLNYAMTVRFMRIFSIILRHHSESFPPECEIALGLLNHMLDVEANTQWKRILSLEFMRKVYSDPEQLFTTYARLDGKDERKPVIRDNISALVRIATEKSANIGLGQNKPSLLSLSTGSIEGPEKGDSNLVGADNPTISITSSLVKTACLEQLEKSEPPTVPDTYVYTLILNCITGLADSIAKFILPLTVSGESRDKRQRMKEDENDRESEDREKNEKNGESRLQRSTSQMYRQKTVPINPLTLKGHKAYEKIKAVADFVETCWPGILAASSTFLLASIDSEFYRALVRSMQKFTQVAGLLQLQIPRDAFLTTLSKSVVPPSVLSTVLSPSVHTDVESSGIGGGNKGTSGIENMASRATSLALDRKRRTSMDLSNRTLTPRNMLCLRALLNLAIALGPTLNDAWSIIFETLQQSDLVTAITAAKSTSDSSQKQVSDFGLEPSIINALNSEIEAVQAVTYRLFESTVDYPNESYVHVLRALSGLLHSDSSVADGKQDNNQRRAGSIASMTNASNAHIQIYLFALGKIGDIATLNVKRFTTTSKESGWDIIVNELIFVIRNESIAPPARCMAAAIISRLSIDIASKVRDEKIDREEPSYERLLGALYSVINALSFQDFNDESTKKTKVDIHVICLEALKTMVEKCGNIFNDAWNTVFRLLSSVFYASIDAQTLDSCHVTNVISSNICRLAFDTIELICADFIPSIPQAVLPKVVDILGKFALQRSNLNISLTSIAFLSSIMDFLRNRLDGLAIQKFCSQISDIDWFRKNIREAIIGPSVPALWLHSLLTLAETAADDRVEVRNGAIQTTVSIFTSGPDLLDPQLWIFGIKECFLKMLESNYKAQLRIREFVDKDTFDFDQETTETSDLIFQKLASVIGSNVEVIASANNFQALWNLLLQYLQKYLDLEEHELNKVVYIFLKSILSYIKYPSILGEQNIKATADLWIRRVPRRSTQHIYSGPDQESYIAYINAWKELHRLIMYQDIQFKAEDIARNLKACIEESNDLAYIVDLERLTELQSKIIESIETLVIDKIKALEMMPLLAHFSTLYLTKKAQIAWRRNKITYVALAKASIDILKIQVVRLSGEQELYESGRLSMVLESLTVTIRGKYKWKMNGGSLLWRIATNGCLSILDSVFINYERLNISNEQNTLMWERMVNIYISVSKADLESSSPETKVEEDENFDLDALIKLQRYIIPLLGSQRIPERIRQDYSFGLYSASIIHASRTHEHRKLDNGLLSELYTTRHGRTIDPLPSPRLRVAYYCSSQLFQLVLAANESKERLNLARAAVPSLLLRICLPLKDFNSDQPLRGRMPLPWAQKEELIYLLQQVRCLGYGNHTIAEVKQESFDTYGRLRQMFPLLIKALGFAEKDIQLLEEIRLTVHILENKSEV